jgi:hypothetical protein
VSFTTTKTWMTPEEEERQRQAEQAATAQPPPPASPPPPPPPVPSEVYGGADTTTPITPAGGNPNAVEIYYPASGGEPTVEDYSPPPKVDQEVGFHLIDAPPTPSSPSEAGPPGDATRYAKDKYIVEHFDPQSGKTTDYTPTPGFLADPPPKPPGPVPEGNYDVRPRQQPWDPSMPVEPQQLPAGGIWTPTTDIRDPSLGQAAYGMGLNATTLAARMKARPFQRWQEESDYQPLRNTDPYAPVLQPILDAIGYGDPQGQWTAGQAAYATGTPAPTPDKKGEAVAQDLVDLQHSGLGQAVGGAVDALLPFSSRYRRRPG